MKQYDPSVIKQIRHLYVFKCYNLHQISRTVDIPRRTLSRWKTLAKKNGDCWNSARSNALMANSEAGSVDILLNEFITLFNATVEQVKNDASIPPMECVKALATLSDAYTKTIKAAGKTHPKKTQLAIALDVIGSFIKYLEKEKAKDAVKLLLPHLEKFGQYYKRKLRVDAQR